jgi:hypothetical protein
MRTVALYTLLSLDGVAEEPGDWTTACARDVPATSCWHHLRP